MQEQLTPDFRDYELIDTGNFEKLERFGRYVTRRPEPQAIWRPSLAEEEWRRLSDASFLRDARSDERGEWRLREGMPSRWTVEYRYRGMRLRMRLGLTSFKHVGIFPEQAANWDFIYDNCLALGGDGRTEAPRVLNLFAYTGGATLAARAAGAGVTHVDSVKQVVTWARENMEQSGLEGVRWIVEDALKFVQREVRRGNRYDGIILDPPAYGRGANGEKWVLEEGIGEMLACCAQLLEPERAFLVLNLYSMGLSSTLARTAVRQAFGAPREEQWGELCFTDRGGKELPLGTYYRFTR
ncbi:class I SAM-dependent methyltransferase [uncultured Alistipes sp.]|uniref:class I SAM-dependent methyltransferase n=1 Tax=uncultured Alistipes sp. TaxID=538949 RepID=UPI0025EDF052|nr:class I SAM-dependent methyltransferase [uncultured Alistipes sp.]